MKDGANLGDPEIPDELLLGAWCEDCAPQWRRAAPSYRWVQFTTSTEGRATPCSECGENLGETHWQIETESET